MRISEPGNRFKTLSYLSNSQLNFGRDPKPGYGRRNLARLGLVVAGAGTFYLGPAAVWHALEADTAKATSIVTTDYPQSKGAVDTLHEGVVTVRAANNTFRSVPGTKAIEGYYLAILQWEALSIAIAALKAMPTKGLRQKKIYKDIHKQGITGKGQIVGIVDSGYRHSLFRRKHDVTYYSADDLKNPTKPQDRIGHGTAVTNIIADAAPDAKFIVVSYSTPHQEAKIKRDLMKLMETARKNPDSITLNDIRKIYAPLIENIANSVKELVDQGARVINVSLSVEQAVQMSLMMNTLIASISLASLKLLTRKSKQNTPEFKEKLKTQKAFVDKLNSLRTANHNTEVITDEIHALYKPWIEALDYAAQHGAAVHLAAGNSGGHKNRK